MIVSSIISSSDAKAISAGPLISVLIGSSEQEHALCTFSTNCLL